MLKILEDKLTHNPDGDSEAKAFYLKLKADYNRYLSDVYHGE